MKTKKSLKAFTQMKGVKKLTNKQNQKVSGGGFVMEEVLLGGVETENGSGANN